MVGNGTYGQVYKVGVSLHLWVYFVCAEAETGAQTHTPRFFPPHFKMSPYIYDIFATTAPGNALLMMT